MARLDIDRQLELEPKRIKYAIDELQKLGIMVTRIGKRIEFEHKGSKVMFYPYSGWATGKTIKDCRGIENLLNQLK